MTATGNSARATRLGEAREGEQRRGAPPVAVRVGLDDAAPSAATAPPSAVAEQRQRSALALEGTPRPRRTRRPARRRRRRRPGRPRWPGRPWRSDERRRRPRRPGRTAPPAASAERRGGPVRRDGLGARRASRRSCAELVAARPGRPGRSSPWSSARCAVRPPPALRPRVPSSSTRPSRMRTMRVAGGGHVVVVGDEEDRLAAGVQPAEQLEHLEAALGVERAGRLVGEQQRGRVGQGPGDGQALALAARQHARRAAWPCRPGRAGRAGRGPGSRPAGGSVPAITAGQGHVLEHAHALEQVEELEDDADVARAACGPARSRPCRRGTRRPR